MAATSSTGSTSTPSRMRKIAAWVMVGSVCATIIVHGIHRSGTSRRNLSQASVGANEPMPSVSKKLVAAPTATASALGLV
jgi:hypothetical protein